MTARVERLRVSPVKGLPQREVAALTLSADGIVEDRRFLVIDESDRVLYSVYLPQLASTESSWDEASRVLELRFADGEVVASRVELGAGLTAAASGGTRVVRGRLVLGVFADALSERCGKPLRLAFADVGVGPPGPITVLGDGTVRRLAEQLGVSELDSRRLKMSIEVAGLVAHEEDAWHGHDVRIGDALVHVAGQVPRCALITQDPDTRARDLDTLRAILAYRAPMESGEAPLGMYATVLEPGVIRVGDEVSVESAVSA